MDHVYESPSAMMRFEPVPEPPSFHEEVRERGARWLKDNPKAKHPYPLWNKYTPELADGFRHLCGYSAMWVEEGTVDHYLSWKNRPDLAYEWSNYRFASDRMIERINPHSFEDEQACFRKFEDGHLTLQGLRRDAPRIAQAIDDELAQPRLPKR